jgi:hypothetical protein
MYLLPCIHAHLKTGGSKGCPSWGANPGSFGVHLFSYRSSAEPQRLPRIKKEELRVSYKFLKRLEARDSKKIRKNDD